MRRRERFGWRQSAGVCERAEWNPSAISCFVRSEVACVAEGKSLECCLKSSCSAPAAFAAQSRWERVSLFESVCSLLRSERPKSIFGWVTHLEKEAEMSCHGTGARRGFRRRAALIAGMVLAFPAFAQVLSPDDRDRVGSSSDEFVTHCLTTAAANNGRSEPGAGILLDLSGTNALALRVSGARRGPPPVR